MLVIIAAGFTATSPGSDEWRRGAWRRRMSGWAEPGPLWPLTRKIALNAHPCPTRINHTNARGQKSLLVLPTQAKSGLLSCVAHLYNVRDLGHIPILCSLVSEFSQKKIAKWASAVFFLRNDLRSNERISMKECWKHPLNCVIDFLYILYLNTKPNILKYIIYLLNIHFLESYFT